MAANIAPNMKARLLQDLYKSCLVTASLATGTVVSFPRDPPSSPLEIYPPRPAAPLGRVKVSVAPPTTRSDASGAREYKVPDTVMAEPPGTKVWDPTI